MIEKATDGVAILAVLTGFFPHIYSVLSGISQFAALLMPILGSVWLVIQITGAVRKNKAAICRWLRITIWGKANG